MSPLTITQHEDPTSQETSFAAKAGALLLAACSLPMLAGCSSSASSPTLSYEDTVNKFTDPPLPRAEQVDRHVLLAERADRQPLVDQLTELRRSLDAAVNLIEERYKAHPDDRYTPEFRARFIEELSVTEQVLVNSLGDTSFADQRWHIAPLCESLHTVRSLVERDALIRSDFWNKEGVDGNIEYAYRLQAQLEISAQLLAR